MIKLAYVALGRGAGSVRVTRALRERRAGAAKLPPFVASTAPRGWPPWQEARHRVPAATPESGQSGRAAQ